MDLETFDPTHNNHHVQPEFGDTPSSSQQLLQSMLKPVNEWQLDDISNVAFSSVEDAEKFYNSYAFEVGFSIRKDKMKIDGDVMTMRSFVCSKAGFRRSNVDTDDGGSHGRKKSRLNTRCGCKASFKVRRRTEDGLFYPVEFNTIHNHDVVDSMYSHFLPSHRHVDDVSAHQIAELRAAGIKPSLIMHVMVKNRGGFENVGFTRKDLYNHVYNSRVQSESSYECELALQYLQGLARTDPGVYVRVDTDQENRVIRMFFTDTISRSEYNVFGDVVMCDSTYKTNHLRLPLALLVGVDNHYNTIVYACALLITETTESYKWVYETFVACMGRAPGLMITDGDLAMRAAIREVMPNTRHRLCYWHIMRNLGGVCHNSMFKSELHIMMRNRFPEHIFWQKWYDMLSRYGVLDRNPRWASEMTSSATLWAESFFVGIFIAGLFSNQRAESANSSLKTHVNVSLTVAQFFHKYFVFLDCLRQGSMRQECINSQAMPPNITKKLFKSIRTQVASTYTLAVYAKVDRHILESDGFRCDIVNLVSDSTIRRLIVYKYDEQDETDAPFNLTYDRRDCSLSCSCRMVETNGVPCPHMFAAMKQLDMIKIAEANLTPRWMKNARSMCRLSSSASLTVTGNVNRLAIVRPHCERLAHFASLGDDHLEMAMPEIERLTRLLETLPVTDELVQSGFCEVSTTNSIVPTFGDPPVARTKGAPSQRRASTTRHCTYCQQPGHSKQTCDQRIRDVTAQKGKGKGKL